MSRSLPCSVSLLAFALLLAGCGPWSPSRPAGVAGESDCGDCPNSRLFTPQVGPEESLNPLFASWAPFPLNTEIAHVQIETVTAGPPREIIVTQRLVERTSERIFLERTQRTIDLQGRENKESKKIILNSSLPRSAEGNEPFFAMNEPGQPYEVEGKRIDVFITRSASFGQEGERRSETLVSPSVPGLVAKKTTRDESGKIVSQSELIRFSIGF